VFNEQHNLNDPVDDSFNDKTRSIVILEGNWEFFKDSEYNHKLGPTLGPGVYKSVNQDLEHGSEKQISSLRVVK